MWLQTEVLIWCIGRGRVLVVGPRGVLNLYVCVCVCVCACVRACVGGWVGGWEWGLRVVVLTGVLNFCIGALGAGRVLVVGPRGV